MPTIEERLSRARSLSLLITYALNASPDAAGFDGEEVTDAVEPMIREIHAELHWIQNALPAAASNLDAPES